jgi:hypothetical protein
MALTMQPRGHFVHALATLREEFICAIEGRLINLNIEFLIGAQRAMSREDEVRGDGDIVEKKYRLRTFIPASVLGTDQYWSGVASKCFAISSQLGAPTFFLTFTMNPYWPEFVALRRGKEAYSDSAMMAIVFKARLGELMRTIKSSRVLGDVNGYVWRVEYQSRGLPHAHILLWTDCDTDDLPAVEQVINVRYPKRSPFLLEDSKVDDWRELIDADQIHHHSKRCELPDHSCRYGYRQPACAQTVIRRRRYQFARDEEEGWIVPHNLFLLALFRSHQCLEVIHSEQAIGYVMQYCSKNSDTVRGRVGNVLYEGAAIWPGQQLQYYAATRVCSAPESFAAICGFWRHHMVPTVISLGIHLKDMKIRVTGPFPMPRIGWMYRVRWRYISVDRMGRTSTASLIRSISRVIWSRGIPMRRMRFGTIASRHILLFVDGRSFCACFILFRLI